MTSLVNILKNLGANQLFDDKSADFSPMCNSKISIDEIF